MELIQYPRQNRFYYINYFYFPEVREEAIKYSKIRFNYEILVKLSVDELTQYLYSGRFDVDTVNKIKTSLLNIATNKDILSLILMTSISGNYIAGMGYYSLILLCSGSPEHFNDILQPLAIQQLFTYICS